MRLLIRADATPSIGTGHVMRCLALAQAAQDAGLDVCLVARLAVPWVRERLAHENIPVSVLEGTPPAQEDPHTLLQDLAQAAAGQPPNQCWVVLDGYHFDTTCQKAVKKAGYRLMVIDDYNHLPEYHCDILLNQNVNAAEYKYCGQIAQKLLGLEYVLLRREFRNAPQREPRATVKNILVTLGGGDFSIHLKNIARTMQIPEMQGRVVRVIAGAMPHERIREAFAACPCALEILSTVDDMAALLAETDLCITAGGSTCWELCALGVPFFVVSLAENQHGIVEYLTRKKIATYLSKDNFGRSLVKLPPLTDIPAPPAVDGEGARLVGQHMLAHGAEGPLVLRRVQPIDESFLLDVANNDAVRSVSFQTHVIAKTEHHRWFTQQLERRLPFYIGMFDGMPCGYARFDRPYGNATISVALSTDFCGKGLGTILIMCACHKVFSETDIKNIMAYIKPDNEKSIRAFERARFRHVFLQRDTIVMRCVRELFL